MNHSCCQVLVPPCSTSRVKTLVVLGCPKGGTSLVSGALHHLGVFMGEYLDEKYEDPDFHPSLPVEKIKNTIKERNEEYLLWGWKRPNTHRYFLQVFRFLLNPHLVVVYRNPLNIAQSSTSRQRKKFTQQDITTAVDHYKEIHEVIDSFVAIPRFVCTYEGVLESKEQFILALANFCEIEPSTRQLMRCMSFIDPKKGYQAP